MRTGVSPVAYALLVFVAGASYGFIVPVVKLATSLDLTVYGFLPSLYLAAFAMSAIVCVIRRPGLPSRRGLLQLALLGVLTSSTSACYYNAVALLPSAVALTLLFQYVWVGVLIDCIVSRKLPDRGTVIAVVVVLVGTVFAAGLVEGSLDQLDPAGLAYGMGSAVFYALFLFFSGRVQPGSATMVRTMMVGVGGFAVTLVLNPAYFATSFLDGLAWPFAVLLAIIGVLLPVGLIGLAGPHLSVGTVNVMASSELPVGVLSAWALMGEVPSALTLAGVVLVLIGIVLAQRGLSRNEEAT